jgi:hypothetical protein
MKNSTMSDLDILRGVETEVRAAVVDRNQPQTFKPVTIAAEDLGRLSAEAVQAQYEYAARSVEGMGDAIRDRMDKLSASMADSQKDMQLLASAAEQAMKKCEADMKLLTEAAAAIRDKGKFVYAQIDEASAVSKSIGATAAEFKAKLS